MKLWGWSPTSFRNWAAGAMPAFSKYRLDEHFLSMLRHGRRYVSYIKHAFLQSPIPAFVLLTVNTVTWKSLGKSKSGKWSNEFCSLERGWSKIFDTHTPVILSKKIHEIMRPRVDGKDTLLCFANNVLLGCNPVIETGILLEGVCLLYLNVYMYILYDMAIPVYTPNILHIFMRRCISCTVPAYTSCYHWKNHSLAQNPCMQTWLTM